jgi:hypothetical protein
VTCDAGSTVTIEIPIDTSNERTAKDEDETRRQEERE